MTQPLPRPRTTPHYYLMPDGVTQVKDVAHHLTSNGGQAVGYVARSTRLDGRNKQDTIEGQIEDLEKARAMIDDEIMRLEELKTTTQAT